MDAKAIQSTMHTISPSFVSVNCDMVHFVSALQITLPISNYLVFKFVFVMAKNASIIF